MCKTSSNVPAGTFHRLETSKVFLQEHSARSGIRVRPESYDAHPASLWEVFGLRAYRNTSSDWQLPPRPDVRAVRNKNCLVEMFLQEHSCRSLIPRAVQRRT